VRCFASRLSPWRRDELPHPMKHLLAFTVACATVASLPAFAADKHKLVILFTGDDTGEIEPCG